MRKSVSPGFTTYSLPTTGAADAAAGAAAGATTGAVATFVFAGAFLTCTGSGFTCVTIVDVAGCTGVAT